LEKNMSDINGIITWARKEQSSGGKTMVRLSIAKSVGTKQYPKWAKFNVMAVGGAATTLAAMLDTGNLPFGKNSPKLSIIEDCEWAITGSQSIQAQPVMFDGQNNIPKGKTFNTELPQMTMFKVQVMTKDRKLPQGNAQQNQPYQAPAQQAPAQQSQPYQAPAQQAPAQQSQPHQAPAQQGPVEDNFDDDIPF
jgi:hypothetical protein